MARRRYKKKKLLEAPVTVTIESFAHDGRGLAHVDGKVVFVDEALPGEQVEFIYTDSRRDYAEGKVVNVITSAPERGEPGCPHYGVCGGCSFQHVKEPLQIEIKQAILEDQFKRIGKLDIPLIWEPLTGPFWGYRQKARMGVKYVAKKGRVLVGFRERRQPFLADIESCRVMHPAVGERLMDLSAMIGQLTIKDKIPQIEVAIGDSDVVLAIRVLESPTDEDCVIIRDFAKSHNIVIYLQPKGPNSIIPLWPDAGMMPSYALPDHQVSFKFKPTMFTQVNSTINRKMIDRVIDILALTKEDRVLDLFCGLGNFTLPLARYAGHVVGVEGDLPLVNHAQENACLNNISNVDFFKADLFGDLSAQSWVAQTFTKVLLDPSRAGAVEVLAWIPKWKPECIVYVSCNPATLARDAGILVNELGYRLEKAGVMDMFPQTSHVESIAVFRR